MVTSKKQKLKKRILDSLKDKAELSTNKGNFISTNNPISKKVRKHSGRYTPQLSARGKYSEIIANAEEPAEEYDDWKNYKDSFRDKTKIRNPDLFGDDEFKEEAIKRNLKIKKQLAIRKAKKEKKELEELNLDKMIPLLSD